MPKGLASPSSDHQHKQTLMRHVRSFFSFSNLLSLGLVLNLFLMRPSALGERYTMLGVLIAPALAGLYLFHTRRVTRYTTPLLRSETGGLLTLIAVYWLYMGPVSIFSDKSQLLWTMYELVTTTIVVVSYSAILLDVNANRLFFRQLCSIVALLGLSSCVTVLLTFYLGSKDSLYLFTMAVKGYADDETNAQLATGAIYFPFSMLYGGYTSGLVSFDRYCAFFREAGIYQAVACFCLIHEALTRRSRIVVAGLVGGVVCAFSTLGITLLAISAGLIFLLSGAANRRMLAPRLVATMLFVGLAWPVALYTPYIGLKDKEQTHGASVSDRADSVKRSMQRFEAHPFGTGLFSGTELNDGISLLAQLGMLGLFGFTCQVMILSAWRPGAKVNWAKVGACSPILITALLSQPIAGAPTIYVILLAYLPRVRQRVAVVKKPEPTLAEVLAGIKPGSPVIPSSADQVPALHAVLGQT
jgi:hypothetical protein